MRRLAFACFALALLAPASPAGAARPHSTHARRAAEPGTLGTPPAPPARPGPVHLPPDLARLALREVEEDEIPADDRPESPLYQPAGEGVRAAAAAHATAFGANVRINTLVGTPVGNGESEVSLAALGNKLVSGWNDGQYWQVQPGFVGYGYSTDGGVTWTDGGSLPTQGASDVFYGDPVIVADPAGHWYFADLWRPSASVTGISVTHGTFAGAAPAWGPPVTIATSASDYLDKPWLAVDPASGTVYVAYVRFYSGGQRLEFARSTDHGLTWSTPAVLTDVSTFPMSPRLQVGPAGELYVAYYAYSSLDGLEYLRVRRSLD